jgi:uncharacterized protein (TIGR00255 family)
MMRSMTAFSRAEKTDGTLTASIEIRSYNSRHLDLAVRVPHGYLDLEEKVKTLISGKVMRGRIEVQLKIREDAEEAFAYEVNEAAVAAYGNALERIRKRFGMTSEIPLDLIARANGVIRPAEIEKDTDALWSVVEAGLVEALEALNAMRDREGRYLENDFNDRLDAIEAFIDGVETGAADLPTLYRDRLKERIGALTEGIVEIDPARIAQEAAILADRSDISEEIVRARSHVAQFRAIMGGSEPAGRKLNFLLQEFNREFNTMGSKAGNAKLSHMIVSVKSELEKMREQVQNIE